MLDSRIVMDPPVNPFKGSKLRHHLADRAQPEERNYSYITFKPLASLWEEGAEAITALFPSPEYI